MGKSSSLTAGTVVLGLFDGMEVVFSVGDVALSKSCRNLNGKKGKKRQYPLASNVRKIDEEHPGQIPTKLSLCDSRLTNLSVPKEKIFNFLRAPLVPAPNTTTTIDQKREKPKTIKMNPRRNC